ncbi:MAG: hypothetical protein LBT30_02160 [Clostridiales bacterium]|jgi:hypothetical protein|nr:hypothetical protein [Clostridiales bacterium]
MAKSKENETEAVASEAETVKGGTETDGEESLKVSNDTEQGTDDVGQDEESNEIIKEWSSHVMKRRSV